MPYIVALTGGIASGKTTIANLFAQLGVPIIDADMIARQVVKPDTPAYQHIVAHFGQHIVLPSRELNRAKLRNIIFNYPEQRSWLNQYLHPIIQSETQQQIMQFHTPYVIWVVPLLIENQWHKYADRILIIETSQQVQLERLQKRDKIDKNLAKNMISSQITSEDRRRYADDIIINDDQTADLSQQVTQLHKQYLKLSQKII
ncbi:dephospho-CoA kinase [Frischella sp. Ac48]|uniref:dephospho-CoA kinase n=1 Tax=Frischella sp. Ac48 TaxID=2804531 RepID=UPI001C7DC739|nr:dephospho-CoA kinase [Frischella sp. Ac48]MBX4133098.1 dephospho-CoA kinase [Frischella sp. Ac48]